MTPIILTRAQPVVISFAFALAGLLSGVSLSAVLR